jgi:hypothetical protein
MGPQDAQDRRVYTNENCTWLAQIARLGPTLWLKIPIKALKLAHNLGQPCTIFVFKKYKRVVWISRGFLNNSHGQNSGDDARLDKFASHRHWIISTAVGGWVYSNVNNVYVRRSCESYIDGQKCPTCVAGSETID